MQRARAALRRQPRIRLRAGQDLPSGAELVRREPDGVLVVQTETDAMRWLQGVDADAVESAELGVDRLEDLYQLLLEGDAPDDAGGAL